ncbi:unnamed protein product [marine sediment metagenome]|uniref:Uncharacterized protein n=1 Tax=marine sediment metagenome TaxID=412755 RepID=X1P9F7_9ZZZZ
MEAVGQMKRIIIYALQPFFHFKPPLTYRPAQAGAEWAYF